MDVGRIAMLWDAIILIFTIVGLYRRRQAHSSPLWIILYRQGVGYLLATTTMNIPMLVRLHTLKRFCVEC